MAGKNNSASRRNFIKTVTAGGAALSLSGVAGTVLAADKLTEVEAAPIKPDVLVRSTAANTVYGYYGYDVPPVATVKDGDVVEIQTINTTGISRRDPEAFFKANNLPIDEQARDIIDIYKNVKRDPSGITGHMLTGPIYIEGAEPGDTLEVRILDIVPRSDYGVNSVWPKGGVIGDMVTSNESFVYKYDKKKKFASFKEGVAIPIRPFMGVMALSPPPEMKRVSSIPPGFYGGNLDLKHLVKGTTLFLPVSVKGGLFTTGDCHAAEGNGEIDGVSIEASLSLTVKFVVRKDLHIKQVYAETPTHLIAIGLDKDLNQAMKNAAKEAVQMIQNLGYTFNEALSISAVGVDFEVTQVVDQTLGVHGMIPKSIFTDKVFRYWNA